MHMIACVGPMAEYDRLKGLSAALDSVEPTPGGDIHNYCSGLAG